MSNADMLAFASAVFCGALALIVVWNERRSVAHWAFVAGMAALAAEEVFFALTADAATPEEMVYWQNWRSGRQVISARNLAFFQPDICPRELFRVSETMASGRWWRPSCCPSGWSFCLAMISLFPPAKTETGHWMFGLGIPGNALNLFCLIGLGAGADESGAHLPGGGRDHAVADQVHDSGAGSDFCRPGLRRQPGASLSRPGPLARRRHRDGDAVGRRADSAFAFSRRTF